MKVVDKGSDFYSLVVIMILVVGCYCGENNNKRDSGLGGEDVKVHCGMGYYPAWDSECGGVEGCKEVDIGRCGCHCRRCYYNKCVEVGCDEVCDVGYYDVEEVRENELVDVEEEIWVDEVRDAGVEDVSELEDVYNPYGPHFKLLAKRVGFHTRIRGDYIMWSTVGYTYEPPWGISGSDYCFYQISTGKSWCMEEHKGSRYSGVSYGNIWGDIACWAVFYTQVNLSEVKFSRLSLGEPNSELIYSGEVDGINYGINSKYIIYQGPEGIYKYEIKTGRHYRLNTEKKEYYAKHETILVWEENVLFYMLSSGNLVYYNLDTDEKELLNQYFDFSRNPSFTSIWGDEVLLMQLGQNTGVDVYMFHLRKKELNPIIVREGTQWVPMHCTKNIIFWQDSEIVDAPQILVLYDLETKAERKVVKDYGGWVGWCSGKYMVVCPNCSGSIVGDIYLIDLEEMGLIKDGHVVPE